MLKKNWLCMGLMLVGLTACGVDYDESQDMATPRTSPAALEETDIGDDCDSTCQCNRKCAHECGSSSDANCMQNCRGGCVL